MDRPVPGCYIASRRALLHPASSVCTLGGLGLGGLELYAFILSGLEG